MVILIDVVEQLVELRRDLGRVGGEVEQHDAVLGSHLRQAVFLAVVVLQLDVDERSHVGIHGIGRGGLRTAAALTVKQQVHQIVGPGIVGAEGVERVGHRADDAQVIVIEGIKQRLAVDILVDGVIGHNAAGIGDNLPGQLVFPGL